MQDLGSRRPPARANLLARLRWGQAICRLAKLARLLIRNGAGRGERARTFDPSFAAQYIDAAWVDAFTTIPPLAGHVAALKRELPAYLSKCAGATFDHTDVAEFTKGVLLWWANNGKDFPTWALAMQIVGSFTPNSAAAERVFSLLKLMFGDLQMSALEDMIQAALMLTYNGRKVG